MLKVEETSRPCSRTLKQIVKDQHVLSWQGGWIRRRMLLEYGSCIQTLHLD